jgi:PilZ domain
MSQPSTKTSEGSTPAAAEERRVQKRYAFTASAELVERESGTRVQARVNDIGRGGCYVDTQSTFPKGCVLKVRLSRENLLFEALGEVAYSLTGMGMGIKFTLVEPEQLGILQNWIAEASGESASPAQAVEVDERPAIAELSTQAIEQQLILQELIVVLMRQGVLSDADGHSMLRRLRR